jgi:hypothetical protein
MLNKNFEKELVERIVEKRGWHWALTSFAIEAWGERQQANNIDRYLENSYLFEYCFSNVKGDEARL